MDADDCLPPKQAAKPAAAIDDATPTSAMHLRPSREHFADRAIQELSVPSLSSTDRAPTFVEHADRWSGNLSALPLNAVVAHTCGREEERLDVALRRIADELENVLTSDRNVRVTRVSA